MRIAFTSLKARALLVVALAALAALLAAGQASAAPYQVGDVFAAGGNAKVKVFDPATGTLKQTLDNGTGSTFTTGMCFDGSDNFYSTNDSSGDTAVSKFDNSGNLVDSTFTPGATVTAESCVWNASNQMYTGGPFSAIGKFDSSGNQLDSFTTNGAGGGTGGTDWVDLAKDQCTIYYTSEGTEVGRYNVCTDTQLTPFATGLPGPCFALRIRSNGEVMVACQPVQRLDSSGNVIQTYPGLGGMFALNLDPDGNSFWTGKIGGTTGDIFRADISSGAVLKTFDSQSEQGLFGLAVFGELTAATQEGPPGDPTCSDGIDNDQDGQIDAADSDCQAGPPVGCRIGGVGGFTDVFSNGGLVVSKGDSLSSDTSKPIAPPNSSAAQKFHLAWGTPADPKQHTFKMTKLSKATCIDTPGVDPGQGQTIDTFLAEGEGTVDGAPGFNFSARLIDKGEPGTGKDTVHVKITKKSDGSLVFAGKGTLSSGNQDSKDGA
jgi:hypothetical protein